MKKKSKKKTTRKATVKSSADNRLRYRPEFNRMTEEYIARNGWDAQGLAAIFGVSDDSIHKWLANRSDFKAAVEAGKLRFAAERPDAEKIRMAEEALLTKVLGHPFEEKKVSVDKEGNESVTVTSGQIAPDVGAIKYYLKNRCPERWTDRQEVKLSGSGNVPLVMLVLDDGKELIANDEKTDE